MVFLFSCVFFIAEGITFHSCSPTGAGPTAGSATQNVSFAVFLGVGMSVTHGSSPFFKQSANPWCDQIGFVKGVGQFSRAFLLRGWLARAT